MISLYRHFTLLHCFCAIFVYFTIFALPFELGRLLILCWQTLDVFQQQLEHHSVERPSGPLLLTWRRIISLRRCFIKSRLSLTLHLAVNGTVPPQSALKVSLFNSMLCPRRGPSLLFSRSYKACIDMHLTSAASRDVKHFSSGRQLTANDLPHIPTLCV